MPFFLLLAAVASATPVPAPAPAATPTATATATPTAMPTATPGAPGRPRSLADIARERKLVAPRGVDPVRAGPEVQGPLRLEELQDNGAVADGRISVFGKVRNTGRTPTCRVQLFLRAFDKHDVLLAKGETTTDLKVIPPGEAVSFGGRLRVPPGVRGSQEPAPDVLSEGPARTNWSRIARVEGEVLAYSEECR